MRVSECVGCNFAAGMYCVFIVYTEVLSGSVVVDEVAKSLVGRCVANFFIMSTTLPLTSKT